MKLIDYDEKGADEPMEPDLESPAKTRLGKWCGMVIGRVKLR